MLRSRSTMSRTVTLCTRPADREGRTFFHSTGDSSYPTKRSSTRRACWAITKGMLTCRGLSMARKMAFLVISLKTMRLVLASASPRASCRCQLMASPSRSSSVASHTVSADLASFFNSLKRPLSAVTSYVGMKPFSTSTANCPPGKSRMWP